MLIDEAPAPNPQAVNARDLASSGGGRSDTHEPGQRQNSKGDDSVTLEDIVEIEASKISGDAVNTNDTQDPTDVSVAPAYKVRGARDSTDFFVRGRVFEFLWHVNIWPERKDPLIRTRNFLPILINGLKTNALPDTGSLANVISEKYAASQGAFIDRRVSKQRGFVNAVGNSFKSVGETTIMLAFPDVPGKVFTEVFSVVADCAVHLVMGDSFLTKHEILTRFRNRLEKVALTARKGWRLMNMNVPHKKFVCRIDGDCIPTNVDTGSERDFLSHDYARYRGWRINPLPPDIGFVELADGEIVKVAGHVSKQIEIGGHQYENEFYILDGLMCNVLFGDETIERLGLYNEDNKRNWIDPDSSGTYSEFHAISWLNTIEDHVSNFLNDTSYRIPHRHMRVLLTEVQHQKDSSDTLASSKEQRKWWRFKQKSRSKQQTRINEQYLLLLSGIWTKLGRLDNVELEARETARRAMTHVTDEDLRKLQSADDTRRQQHTDERTRLLELRSKLLESKASNNNQSS